MKPRVNTITRRNFFSRTGFFFSATVIAREYCRAQDAPRAIEPDAPRAIGLGFSLYGMKSLSIDAALAAVSEIGYDCIELPVMKEWPADSATFDRQKGARLKRIYRVRTAKIRTSPLTN